MALRDLTRSVAGGALSSGMARLNARHPWSHNDHFHRWILDHLPVQRRAALDVGCGQGGLVATLAPYFGEVVGNDVDATMRVAASQLCSGLANVRIDGGDWSRLDGPFDLVTMVAVLHHLEVGRAPEEVRGLLSPGGRFLAVGLAPPTSIADHAWDVASIVTNPVIGFIKHPRANRGGPQPPPYPVQDPTTTYDDLRRHVAAVMPGARMRHRLGFRHTIEWTKPADR
ncbi:class I SAM-dependent methyltransferase [Nocardioides KLBMP 9356]|uniref:Class I SAM-dependent methyltransferase n=1 Tax=Nocardioides potassii TaxID=2911371 RepID=A0ABS9H617_9ACTN|nr:class I SAM-dependent methyltransferase [Nocardioides potassii]MCF6376691.1 class I SAM-dependent methyltransferase [Nocardioides potassii]